MESLVVDEKKTDTLQKEEEHEEKVYTNSLMTWAWGDLVWSATEAKIYGSFSEEAQHNSVELRNAARQELTNFGLLLPCEVCRPHWRKMLEEKLPLTDKDLETRSSLLSWLLRARQMIAERIGKKFDITLQSRLDYWYERSVEYMEKQEAFDSKESKQEEQISSSSSTALLVGNQPLVAQVMTPSLVAQINQKSRASSITYPSGLKNKTNNNVSYISRGTHPSQPSLFNNSYQSSTVHASSNLTYSRIKTNGKPKCATCGK